LFALITCGRAGSQLPAVPSAPTPSATANAPFDATRTGTPVDLRNTPWRFAPGDDPHWADPAFDDSQWKTMTAAKPFAQQGYPTPRGFFWLRLHLRMKPDAANQEIAVYQASYQIFVNGRLLGQQGGMPDHPAYYHAVMQTYPILLDSVRGGSAVIAIREWFSPVTTAPLPYIRLGDKNVLDGVRDGFIEEGVLDFVSQVIRGVVALMIGLWALALFRVQPGHREYLWLGAMGLIEPFRHFYEMFSYLFPVSFWRSLFAHELLDSLFYISFLIFICHFLRLRVNWPVRIVCAFYLLKILSLVAYVHGWASADVDDTALFVAGTSMALIGPWLAIRQYRRGDREAGMLLVAVVVLAVQHIAQEMDRLFGMFHMRARTGSLIPTIHLGPVPVTQYTVTWLLFYLSFGAIMLRRSLAITRQQQRTAEELEAARSVQAFLLGREASAPGYTVESAYLPAQEVGGDFFQTIAGTDGSLLAVIGDVAGKGLQAAMRVSMLIGAVRLSPNEAPAALLRKLNGVLLQDGSSGFTTCLAARLDADGTVTIANAGHLSPYINGQELTIDGGLPLGVAAGIDYTEQTFPFVFGDVMLLMSDGVVEARNPTGELFGFERMARTAAAVSGADSLAATARAFGQDDDITVLLLQRAMAPAV
jgi:hypothetical protein